MVGCEKSAWKAIEPILKKVAAKDFAKNTCAGYLGTGAAGHYVKMVHNGIEYAIMQMIGEAYSLLKSHYRLTNEQIAEFFEICNEGRLAGYLFEIVPPILRKKEGKKYLVDLILDAAKNKGTGKWTSGITRCWSSASGDYPGRIRTLHLIRQKTSHGTRQTSITHKNKTISRPRNLPR